MERGLAGWALRHREIALVPDINADSRWLHLPNDTEKTASALAVPLIYQGQVNGLLTLLHSQRGFFTPAHAALAEAIARQAAIAVENARLHAEVRQERSVLYSLISGLPEPMLLADEAGRVIFINQAAVEILEVEGTNQPLRDLIPQEGVEEAAAQAITTRRPQQMEILRKDGRVFDAIFAPVAGLGVTLCLHDVTRLKQLDQMKSELVTTVSHDLKNPLTLAAGFAELLVEEKGLSPEGRRCVEGIRSSVRKMRALVEKLLNLDQIEAGIYNGEERSEVAQVVAQVVHELQPQAAEKGQSLTVDLPAGLPTVQVSPVLLEEAVSNLVENAIKYTQEGGRIHVEAEPHDGGVTVRVRDNGPGIPKAALPRLFEKFYRVGSPATMGKEGSGLGLAIVRAIVENCNGHVGVESEEGRGSTFWFWLPGNVTEP
jgi:two-component system phosphate regulon sensor histidine kinase PhoR